MPFLTAENIIWAKGTGTEAQMTYNGVNYAVSPAGILNLVSANYAQTTTVALTAGTTRTQSVATGTYS